MDIFGETAERVRIAVLGSTGSVGTQTLELVRQHRDRFEVVALTANSNTALLMSQADEFDVGLIGLTVGHEPAGGRRRVVAGERSSAQVAEEVEAEIVVNAITGAAGLEATLATLTGGKVLALANKESLVAAGEAVMSKAGPGQIRPIDSEHSALWQLLAGVEPHLVRKAFLTSSGGPFRGRSAAQLQGVTVEEALNHPTWNMGRKITVDSATLMNKGLEVIEAHFLFGFTYDEIEVLVHPQSMVHAMVELNDGSLSMHAAIPDMKLPIALALTWPARVDTAAPRLDLADIGSLDFEPVDLETFRCLQMAYEVGRKGDTYPAVMNAANEVAVEAFLSGKIGFLGIPAVIEQVLEEHVPVEPRIEGVLEQDAWARDLAGKVVERMTAS